MSDTRILTATAITIEGVTDPILFGDFSLYQTIASVGEFSFVWRQPEGEGNLSVYLSFTNDHLGKKATIDIDDNFVFEGIIVSIKCIGQHINGVAYLIQGRGMFEMLNLTPACNSFRSKTLSEIFNALNVTTGTDLNLNPILQSPIYYTVQYNQSAFEFFKLLSVRLGEWLYYDGKELHLGFPSNNPELELNESEISNFQINTKIVQPPVKIATYSLPGNEKVLYDTELAPPGGGTGFIEAAMNAGDAVASPSLFNEFSYAPELTSSSMDIMAPLIQHGFAASSAYITGNTCNSELNVGKKINIKDRENNSLGVYIITSLTHNCQDSTNYYNSFTAIPAELERPPYTNPFVVNACPTQVAKVVNNEDPDGYDRVKVRFPWMQEHEESPFLSVVVPIAGENYGMRFFPEVDDLVYVGFKDSDPDFPYIIGSIYSGERKSGIPVEDNSVKNLGTKTGRRMTVYDNDGQMVIADNHPSEDSWKNTFFLERNDNITQIVLQTLKEDNRSVIGMSESKGILLSVYKNDTKQMSIRMNFDSNTISINSNGNIALNAGETLDLKAKNINIEAEENISIKSTQDFTLEALNAEMAADVNLSLKGTQVEIKGDATAKLDATQTEVNGSAMTKITGGVVMIN